VTKKARTRRASGRRPAKLVHNLVLSMPAGTSAAGVWEASRTFAREQFGLKHRYAMVLHTDQPHPHVHLVIKVMSEHGKRLNIRKGDVARVASVAAALREGTVQIESAKSHLLETRKNVVRGWLDSSDALRIEGRHGLAHEIGHFLKGMSPPRTEREWMVKSLSHLASSPKPRVHAPLSR
jgi:hypothetical protein